jgi:hypothetical protein
MPEFLTLMNVGNMHLQDRHVTSFQRVQHGDRGVAEHRRVDNDSAGDLSRLVDPVDDFLFAVALAATDFQTQSRACLAACGFHFGECFVAVR